MTLFLCGGCRRWVAKSSLRQQQAGLYFGPCCYEKVRSAHAEGWPCAECGQVLPEEDMFIVGTCRKCAGVPGKL